jgi:predicted transcriptional regulator with HTH domain
MTLEALSARITKGKARIQIHVTAARRCVSVVSRVVHSDERRRKVGNAVKVLAGLGGRASRGHVIILLGLIITEIVIHLGYVRLVARRGIKPRKRI